MMVTTCASNPGDGPVPGVVKPPEGAVGEDDVQAPATTNRKSHRRGRRPTLHRPSFFSLVCGIGPAWSVFRARVCVGTQESRLLRAGHEAREFLKPVQDDIDLGGVL